MRIVRGAPRVGASREPTVVALGNFDGVHRGHRAVIARASDVARARGAALAVMTFEPHPREVFQPDAPPFRLTLEAAKLARLGALGVETAFILPFDETLRSLDPLSFASAALAGHARAVHVLVGEDFRFGRGRTGDVETLRRLGRDLAFEVEAIGHEGDGDAQFSSSRVRAALRAGRPREAARILGGWHAIEAAVERGDQRGRDLGFPTANQPLDRVLHPAYGVYAVAAEVRDGPHRGRYEGVASIGVRPTFDKTVANCETFLFDFSGDLYGATLAVSLREFLRPEERFHSLDALIDQMRLDEAEARRLLADGRPDPWIEGA